MQRDLNHPKNSSAPCRTRRLHPCCPPPGRTETWRRRRSSAGFPASQTRPPASSANFSSSMHTWSCTCAMGAPAAVRGRGEPAQVQGKERNARRSGHSAAASLWERAKQKLECEQRKWLGIGGNTRRRDGQVRQAHGAPSAQRRSFCHTASLAATMDHGKWPVCFKQGTSVNSTVFARCRAPAGRARSKSGRCC